MDNQTKDWLIHVKKEREKDGLFPEVQDVCVCFFFKVRACGSVVQGKDNLLI